MNARERFQRIMSYQAVDRLPVVVFEPYEAPGLERWRREGLPPGQSPETFLGMDTLRKVSLDFGPIPPFEHRVLWESETHIVETDARGCTLRRRKDAPDMYYGHLDHPVKSMADWERYRERLDPTEPARFPPNLPELAATLNTCDMPVGLDVFPFFFRLGFYLLGMERFLTAFHDSPGLLHDMFSYWSAFVLELLRPILAVVRLDFVSFPEDLAYKTAPHISPDTYREFWIPHLRPILHELHQHGVPIISLYSSGCLGPLLPTVLALGFNATWPVERGAGMDPIALRREYGRALRMGGGISKEALTAGPAAIDLEIERLRPLIAEGGFVPAADDMVPAEVPLAHFRHYVEALKAIRP